MNAALEIAIPRPAQLHEAALVDWLCKQVRNHCNPGDLLLGLLPEERAHIEWQHSSGHTHRQPMDRHTAPGLWWQQLQQASPQRWARIASSPLAQIYDTCPAISAGVNNGGLLLLPLGHQGQIWAVLALFGSTHQICDWQADGALNQLLRVVDRNRQHMTPSLHCHVPAQGQPQASTTPNPAIASAATAGLLEQRLIGGSPLTRQLHQQIWQASQHPLSVLLQGETGTGKEVVARLLHDLSPRQQGPFVAINCAAIPENLIESELFGFQKGAFSGASAAQSGLIAQAHGGTLFLDEVGDMPLTMQAKLLRVLESRHYRPLGSQREQSADFRLVAATHQPLDLAVTERRFRADLYHRLCQSHIQLPPLRERLEDLLPLCQHFIAQFSLQHQRLLGNLDPDLITRLSRYPFPGNVRELRNLLEVACAHTADGSPLLWHSLPGSWQQRLQGDPENGDAFHHIRDLRLALRRFEAEVIAARLDFYQGNRGLAAASLGLPKRTLDHKCQRLALR
jgi:sigma-54 dependent transcriptional regulator